MNRITRRWIAPVVAGLLVVGTYVAARAGDVKRGYELAPLGETSFQNFEMTSKRVSTVAGKGNAAATNAKPDVVFDVDLKRYEYVPNVFRVKKGQVVLFRLHPRDDGLGDLPANFVFNGVKNTVNVDSLSGHGFYIQKYDVWLTGLHKGATREVKIKAIWPGTYSVQCVVLCGTEHYLMTGKFIVEG